MLVLLEELEDEIATRKVAEAKAKELANIDSLTGLTNRRYFYDKASTILSSKFNTEETYGILFIIDIDNFKSINDSLGHLAGDECLRMVSERLMSDMSILQGDISLSRIAGDEFAFMLGTLNVGYEEVRKKAIKYAKLISEKFTTKIKLDNRMYTITVSIGISIFSVLNKSVKDIIKEADLALFEAKRLGKNRFYFYEDRLQQEVDFKLRITNELQNGISKDKFILYYHPIVNDKRDVMAYETLIRWKNIKGEIVSASAFIDLIELSGLTVVFNQYIFNEACAQLKIWQEKGFSEQFKYLSTNISPIAFKDENFCTFVMETIAKHDISPSRVMLEITENNMFNDFDRVEKTMTILNDYGVRFSLDNFGTGYSSLAYIHKLPFTELKIDRSFIHNISDGSRNKKLLSAIVAMAKSMQFRVVAEGIEDENQYEILKALACDYYQGYLFSKPSLPVERV